MFQSLSDSVFSSRIDRFEQRIVATDLMIILGLWMIVIYVQWLMTKIDPAWIEW